MQTTPNYPSKDGLMGDDLKSMYDNVTGKAHGGLCLKQNMLMLFTKFQKKLMDGESHTYKKIHVWQEQFR